jgi:transposase
MNNRKFLPDLKLATIRLHKRGILTTREILECVVFSRRTFLRICKLYRETGDVVKTRSEYIGRTRALNVEDVTYLTELVQHRPDWFLDELAVLMQRNRFISLHYTTIHRELHRAVAMTMNRFAVGYLSHRSAQCWFMKVVSINNN